MMTSNTINRPLPVSHVGKDDRFLKIAVVFATISTIVINALANIVPFNNQQTGEISDRYQTLFVPSGYVFSIWGVIYVGMIAYAIYQARQKEVEGSFWHNVGMWYLLSCVANSVWIFLWHWNQLGWSVIVILILLVSLLAIYLQMSNRGWETGNRSRAETWSVYIPLSIYLAWGCVATVANISTWLWNAQWSGLGISDSGWAIIMLLIAAGLGLVFGGWRKNLAYACVIVWAFVGIGVKQAAVPMVAYSAYALAAIVLVVALWGQQNSKNHRHVTDR